MNEEKIKKELDKAAGSLAIEDIGVSQKDIARVSKIIQKYQDSAGTDAIDSLLYSIQEGLEIMGNEGNDNQQLGVKIIEKGNDNGRKK